MALPIVKNETRLGIAASIDSNPNYLLEIVAKIDTENPVVSFYTASVLRNLDLDDVLTMKVLGGMVGLYDLLRVQDEIDELESV